MSKYIDAERLKELLSNKYKEFTEKSKNFCFMQYQFMADGLTIAEQMVDSLQQEQPKPSGYDKALLEIKSKVDDLYEEASIGLNEYDSGLYNGIAETCMKLRGFIKARLNSDGQKEVDLEKEIQEYLEKLGGGHGGFVDDLTDDDLTGFAHHFYELGLNAKKEKAK